jgi:hypothetical protein
MVISAKPVDTKSKLVAKQQNFVSIPIKKENGLLIPEGLKRP